MSGKYLIVSDVLSGVWKSIILIPVSTTLDEVCVIVDTRNSLDIKFCAGFAKHMLQCER